MMELLSACRLMCGACTVTDDYISGSYEMDKTIPCKTCRNVGLLARSEHVGEDDYVIHQKNLHRLEVLRSWVSRLENVTETFENGWESTWNVRGPAQIDYERPEDFDILDSIED